MKMKFVVQPYLTEQNLGEFLQLVFPEVKSQYSVQTAKKKMRVDYQFIHDEQEYFVEFDGYRHYNDFKTQLRDEDLYFHCKANGIVLIRIPYFVQLRATYLDFVFGCKLGDFMESLVDVDCNYQHGFHSKTAMMPWDFNEYGMRRFMCEATSIHGLKGCFRYIEEDNSAVDQEIEVWSVGREIQSSIRTNVGLEYANMYSKDLLTNGSDMLSFFIQNHFG